MKIPKALARRIQKRLYFLSYDSCYADSFTSGLLDHNLEKVACWQMAVDIIYRLVKGGLMQNLSINEENSEETERKNFSYIQQLAQSNPFSENTDENIVWWIMDFYRTDFAHELVDRYNITGDPEEALNEDFMEEVERCFEANGVGWCETPLIPIRAS